MEHVILVSVFGALGPWVISGYTKTYIGPTKILEKRALTIEEARKLGCPVDNADMFDGDEIIGLRFEPFKESLPRHECSVALDIIVQMLDILSIFKIYIIYDLYNSTIHTHTHTNYL